MNGGIIVAIAIMLIGVIGIGLIVYYIRKGRAERAQANAEKDTQDKASATVDAND